MEISLPKIYIGSHTLSDVDEALKKEWLVTNGLSGYASSTVLGINTRKYHGLLVASLNPPTDRKVLLTQLNEEIQVNGKTYRLGARELKSGIQPTETNRFLRGFILSLSQPTNMLSMKCKLKKQSSCLMERTQLSRVTQFLTILLARF